jgi:hypothetical protein
VWAQDQAGPGVQDGAGEVLLGGQFGAAFGGGVVRFVGGVRRGFDDG